MNFIETDGGRKESGYKTTKGYAHDCVIRSIAIVMDKPYRTVFIEMMNLGIEMGGYPNMRPVYETYLKNKIFIKNKCPRNINVKLITLKNWQGVNRAIVLNHGHLTAVVDGAVHDTWDCRYRPVNSFWTRDTF